MSEWENLNRMNNLYVETTVLTASDVDSIEWAVQRIEHLEQENGRLRESEQHWIRAFARMAMDYSNGSSAAAGELIDMYRKQTAQAEDVMIGIDPGCPRGDYSVTINPATGEEMKG